MMCTRSLGKVIIYEHIMYSLGHSSSLQDLDSVEDPIQSAPPCSGGGLSQVLLLDWLLPPQLTGHELKPVHDPHSPLIGEHWGSWTNGICSVSCEGEGQQTRTRICDNPAPANGGAQCTGSPNEVVSCNNGACPIDGEWGSWTSGTC
jgi:hypothetical protein